MEIRKELDPRTPEEKLLDALGVDKLTDKEAKYLQWLLGRSYTIERKRELFKAKFPNSKWI